MFDVRVSGFLVHPVVAFADREPALKADDYEVVEVFSAPVAAFLPGAPIETVTAERDGYRLRYGGYQIGRHHVWGATAMMLGRFGAYLGRGSSERLPRSRRMIGRGGLVAFQRRTSTTEKPARSNID